MDLAIDPEFEQLIMPLKAEERAQLEANIKAEGCRDPLSVWPQAEGPPILLDGHNRYEICAAHNLPFDITAISLADRVEAMRWIINHQLGRRNLEALQRDVLIGRRYELEKHAEGAPQDNQNAAKQLSDFPIVVSGPATESTAERLATEYQVHPDTVVTNGQFVQGLDELKKVREDLPTSILTKQTQKETKAKGKPKVTKGRVIKVGKLIKGQKVAPLPFMRQGDWKDYQILEALEVMADIPLEEHGEINILLSQPPLPPSIALEVMQNLRARGAEGRQLIYRLFQSEDPRERSLGRTMASETAPEPDPQDSIAERLLIELEKAQKRLADWHKDYPEEPWTAEVTAMSTEIKRLRATLRALQKRIGAAHQERIARYAQASVTQTEDSGAL